MTVRSVRRLGAVPRPAVVLALLTGLLVAALAAPSPSSAAAWAEGACARGKGVTVVTEWAADQATVRCAPQAAGVTAREAFGKAGHALQDVAQSPGFVCRVDARPAPAEEQCVRSPSGGRYWTLWHSPGRDGTWTYANRGVDGLTLPAGSWVAFAFHRGSAEAAVPATRLPRADKRLTVGVRYATVRPRAYQRVTARGLARGERVTVTYRGKTVARATAAKDGTVSQRFAAGTTRGTVTVKVTGEHVGRSGSKTFRVR